MLLFNLIKSFLFHYLTAITTLNMSPIPSLICYVASLNLLFTDILKVLGGLCQSCFSSVSGMRRTQKISSGSCYFQRDNDWLQIPTAVAYVILVDLVHVSPVSWPRSRTGNLSGSLIDFCIEQTIQNYRATLVVYSDRPVRGSSGRWHSVQPKKSESFGRIVHKF